MKFVCVASLLGQDLKLQNVVTCSGMWQQTWTVRTFSVRAKNRTKSLNLKYLRCGMWRLVWLRPVPRYDGDGFAECLNRQNAAVACYYFINTLIVSDLFCAFTPGLTH